MSFSRKMLAGATALSAATSLLLVPSVAGSAAAKPVYGVAQSNVVTNDSLGVDAITATDQSTISPGQQFKVRTLISRNYDWSVYAIELGLGMDEALWKAIDQEKTSVRQLTSDDPAAKDFPATQLAKLPKTPSDSHKFTEPKVEFRKYGSEHYVVITPSPKVNLQDEALAFEFSFTFTGEAPATATIGTYAWTRGSWYFLSDSYAYQVAPVNLKTRQTAHLPLKPINDPTEIGKEVTIEATTDPQVQGEATFTIGDKPQTARITEGTASVTHQMTDKPVKVSASLAETETHTGAEADSPITLTPEPKPVPKPEPLPKPQAIKASEPSAGTSEQVKDQQTEEQKPDDQPENRTTLNEEEQPSGFNIKTDWWKILLGVLGVLGLGGAIAGAFAFLQGPR